MAFDFDTLQTGLCWAGFIFSGLVLGLIGSADVAAAAQERVTDYVRTRRCNVTRILTRVRIGLTPVLHLGAAYHLPLINPGFLLTEILVREPLAIIVPTFAWSCVLFCEPELAAEVAVFGLIWRCVADSRAFAALPEQVRTGSVVLKVVWVCATGVWLASLLYLVVAAFIALLFVVGFAGAGASKKRRSRW